MVAGQAVSYAARRGSGLVTHPRRTMGELVADSTRVVFAGVDVAERVVGTVVERSPWHSGSAGGATVREIRIERPGPVPEEVLADAATPTPKPAPPSAPRTARAVGEELRTPSGITAAGVGHNPDTTETDLVQPGTEPLMDPALTKAVKAETDTLRKAASRRK